MINYEGMLTDDGGTPLDGTYNLSFKIYGSESGNDSLWWEHHTGVTVSDGLFSVILGSISSLSYSVFSDTIRYLGISVDYGTELSPRTRLVSVPYAYRTEWVDTCDYSYKALRADMATHAQYAAIAATDSDWIISGNNMYSAVSGNVGIGTTNPAHKLDVAGTVQTTGFKMPTGASSGHVLTSEGSGLGTWQTVPASGGGWTDDGATVRLTTDNDSVGIGTNDPAAKLHLVGGALQVNTSLVGGSFSRIDGNEISGGTLGPPGSQHLHIRPGDNSSYLLLAEDGGNIGIGTTTPDKILHIGGGGQTSTQTAEGLYVNPNTASVAISAEDNTGVEGGIMAHNNGNVYIGVWSDHSVMFRTNNLDRGIIDAIGNFGIGVTSNPTEKLDVNGTARLRGISDGIGTIVVVDAFGKLWKQSPGNLHRENIRRPGTDPDKVFQLEPVKFDWKTTGVEDIGLIAEDVEKVIPDLVVYDNEGRPHGVRYDRIALYLLDVVKDLKTENDALKSRIEALESKE